jgi:hypothetical protein
VATSSCPRQPMGLSLMVGLCHMQSIQPQKPVICPACLTAAWHFDPGPQLASAALCSQNNNYSRH